MTSANDIQIDGDHYKVREYQHWDFVCDTKMPYLPACASKYASRWKDKGGLVDLDKALHYTQKAAERKVKCVKKKAKNTTRLSRFTQQLPPAEHDIVWALAAADWPLATRLLMELRDREGMGNEMLPA